SLCSALVRVTLSQAPPVGRTDSLATLRGRAAQDSSDAQLWLLMGRAYLGLGVEAHGATHRSSEDSVWTRAVLDTAEEALSRAAALAPAAWRSDAVRRARLRADLKLGRRGGADVWLAELVRRRPVCVSMAFDRPPETRPRIRWETRPLVWVAGPEAKSPRVPPRDFVFGALRVALDASDPWAEPALAAYSRAARATPTLCDA